MIVLQETSEAQDLHIMAREGRINLITFTDEQTREETQVTYADFSDAGYYLFSSVVLDFLEENHTYRLKCYYSSSGGFLDRVVEDGGTISLDSNFCFSYLNSIDAKLVYSDLVFVTNQNVIDNAGIYDIHKDEYTNIETDNEYKIFE